MKKYYLIVLAFFLVQCATTRTSELHQVYDKVNYIYWSESKPLSDTEIQKKLDERGIQVARRTVAKYRSMEGILPAHLRQAL